VFGIINSSKICKRFCQTITKFTLLIRPSQAQAADSDCHAQNPMMRRTTTPSSYDICGGGHLSSDCLPVPVIRYIGISASNRHCWPRGRSVKKGDRFTTSSTTRPTGHTPLSALLLTLITFSILSAEGHNAWHQPRCQHL
jgi:hypothetical protein